MLQVDFILIVQIYIHILMVVKRSLYIDKAYNKTGTISITISGSAEYHNFRYTIWGAIAPLGFYIF